MLSVVIDSYTERKNCSLGYLKLQKWNNYVSHIIKEQDKIYYLRRL